MRTHPGLIVCAAAWTLMLGGHSIATAGIIIPTADGFVQDGVNPFVKDGIPDSVHTNVVQVLNVPGFEDRGVIEFNISNLSSPITLAELQLSVFNSNGPFPFTID